MSKGRKVGSWVLVGLLSALFILSAVMKFIGAGPVLEGFEKYDLAHMRYAIGAGELASALLYLFPLTASLGVLLLSAYMGGAIVTHMANNEPYIFQSVLLVIIWIGYYLRYPEMLASFTKRGTTSSRSH